MAVERRESALKSSRALQETKSRREGVGSPRRLYLLQQLVRRYATVAAQTLPVIGPAIQNRIPISLNPEILN